MRTLLSVSLVAAIVHTSAASQAVVSPRRPPCLPDNAGLTLPPGFCALIVADSLGAVRHLAVAPNGDVLAALAGRRGAGGGVLVLRDTTGDGAADVRRSFGPGGGGTGIALTAGYLYFATNSAVLRWSWTAGQLEPAAPPDTLVSDLTSRGQHAAKSIAVAPDGFLYVNIGAPSNACQEQDRTPGSKGQDPCPLLEIAGGIWRFAVSRTGQTQADGERFVTGIRNAVGLGVHPEGTVYAAQHGRDQLAELWPALFTQELSAELPAEVLLRLERGADFGWPYCFYDQIQRQLVLMPEYGGDGKMVGRCAAKRGPAVAFPGHWAPEAVLFSTGSQFPAAYRGGAFVSFHGSWNRAPLPQAGYLVAYVPFTDGRADGTYRVFADGFAGPTKTPADALHRPMGLATGPDGSLYVGDDKGGRIYRILYRP